MKAKEAKKVRVAAIQMASKNGQIHANLDYAAQLVDQAAKDGAELILLPEFMPTGYVYSPGIWDAGEPADGPTVRWLEKNSKKRGVWLGTSFLEVEGEDFFNTFVLTAPDGTQAGRVRKQTSALYEAFFVKGEPGPHVIETEIGKIGVGICYENYLTCFLETLHKESVDILLMPHSSPSPAKSLFVPRKYVDQHEAELKETSMRFARQLGIPVVMVNKCGPWKSPVPWGPTQDSSFPGLSGIIDSDGTTLARLNSEEATIVADVTLSPARKNLKTPVCHGRWAWEGTWLRNTFLIPETLGRLSYHLSAKRKKKARQISSK